MMRFSCLLTLSLLVAPHRARAQSAADTSAVVQALAETIAREIQTQREPGSLTLPAPDSAMSWTRRVEHALRASHPDLLPGTTPSDSAEALRFRITAVSWSGEHLAAQIDWSLCTRRYRRLNYSVSRVDYEFARSATGWRETKRSLGLILDGTCDANR